jgi:hypothetical protein
MKRDWTRVLLALAFISIIIVLSWFAISYFRKASFLAKALNPKLAIVGDIADAEEYAVYSAIIESAFIESSTELILIDDQTGSGLLDDIVKYGKPWSLEMSADSWNDFVIKNRSPFNVGNSFVLRKPYLLFKRSNEIELNLELQEINSSFE